MKNISMNLGTKLLVIIVIMLFFGCGPKYFKFQSVKYRMGGANRAFIGAVGLMRTEGANTFYVKYMPKWKNVKIMKTGSLKRKEISEDTFEFIAATSKAGIETKVEKEKNLSGKFTIYQIMDIKELVNELNDDRNKEVRDEYLKQSKDFRIITSMVTVEAHSENIEATVDVSGSLTLVSEHGVATIKSKNTVQESMSDNMIYAYEYSRIVWDNSNDDKKNGKVKDIMVDRPGGSLCWHFWDAKSPLKCALSDPKDLKKKKCKE